MSAGGVGHGTRRVFGAVGSDHFCAQGSSGGLGCLKKRGAIIKSKSWLEYQTKEVQEGKATSHLHGESTASAPPRTCHSCGFVRCVWLHVLFSEQG